eukprot:1434125-Rhodomonas_salina.1
MERERVSGSVCACKGRGRTRHEHALLDQSDPARLSDPAKLRNENAYLDQPHPSKQRHEHTLVDQSVHGESFCSRSESPDAEKGVPGAKRPFWYLIYREGTSASIAAMRALVLKRSLYSHTSPSSSIC